LIAEDSLVLRNELPSDITGLDFGGLPLNGWSVHSGSIAVDLGGESGHSGDLSE